MRRAHGDAHRRHLFDFTADALLNVLPATRAVTSERLRRHGERRPARPAHAGRQGAVTASIGGAAWNSATIRPRSRRRRLQRIRERHGLHVLGHAQAAGRGPQRLQYPLRRSTLACLRTGTADAWARRSAGRRHRHLHDRQLHGHGMTGAWPGTIPGLSVGTPLTITDGEFRLRLEGRVDRARAGGRLAPPLRLACPASPCRRGRA